MKTFSGGEYPADDRGEQEFRADQYFAIGQNENQKDSWCWVYLNGSIIAEQGRTHQVHFNNLIRQWGTTLDQIYRGWYDPVQEMISVVTPRKNGDWLKRSVDDLPKRLVSELYHNFGLDLPVEVF